MIICKSLRNLGLRKQERVINAREKRAKWLHKGTVAPVSKELIKGNSTGQKIQATLPKPEVKAEFKRIPGACWRCRERYFPGHLCKYKLLNAITAEEEQGQGTILEEQEESQENEEEIEVMEEEAVCLNAISNTQTAKELRVVAQVDTPMRVTVANGQQMYSYHGVPKVKWKANGVEFEDKFRVLNLGSCDMVLRGDWLRVHTPVTFDYKLYELKIKQGGKVVTLKGDIELVVLYQITAKSIGKILKKGQALLAHLFTIDEGDMSSEGMIPGEHNKLFAKRSKYSFSKSQVEYLGHIITSKGVATDPSKVSAMMSWPVPKSLKGLREFLGLTGYYRRFVKNYGSISKPLTDLLKKNSFQCSIEAEEAFERLKQAMSTVPVLAMPDYNKTFTIKTDARNQGIGAILTQENRPLAYYSKALAPKHKGKSVYEKKYMVVLAAINKWRHYVQGNYFIIKTDHFSLKYLIEQKITTAIQQKGLTKLLGLDYEIIYRKRAENRVADALSRIPEEQGEFQALSGAQPECFLEVEKSDKGDNSAQEFFTTLAINPNHNQDYKLTSGVLRYKGKVYIGKTTTLRQQLLHIMHASALGGHSGQQGTLKRLQLYFFWPAMKKEVQEFVSSCDICQRCKDENIASPGLLQPLAIPTQAWNDISLDFIEGLPKSQGKEVIQVVVYRFTNTAYHPESDGQTKRLNKCLEGYLRAMEMSNPKQWVIWLHLAEWWYNTNYYTALQTTPFFALYGKHLKLCPKFYGPYKVVQRVGKVSYKLELPTNSLIHPVFHVSLLKKRIGPDVKPLQKLSLVENDGKILVRTLAILQRRMVKENNVVAVKVLIQYENLAPEDATWEDWTFIKSQFPDFIQGYAVASSWVVHLWNRVAELAYIGFSFSFSTLCDLIEFQLVISEIRLLLFEHCSARSFKQVVFNPALLWCNQSHRVSSSDCLNRRPAESGESTRNELKGHPREKGESNASTKFGTLSKGKMTNESQMMDATTSVGATNIATSSRTNAPPTMAPAEKPRKFSGIDLKRWQEKMFFYLTTLCIQRLLAKTLLRNYILSGFQDDLYNVYSGTKTSKELWGTFELKYKTVDTGIKKFLVVRFLNFKIIDSKSVVSQVQELQVIIHDLLAEGLIVNDVFQVATIVEKLPPLWKDFKNYLKHKRKEMTVEDLIVRLLIEEDNKAAERRSKGNSTINGAHIVEDHQNNSKKRKKAKQGSNQPKKKFKGKCFRCGKIGHKSTDYRAPKKGKKKDQANMIESNKECDDLCAMFSECNLTGKPREWWMDSGATRHVCANKELFSSFTPAQVEEMIYMANSATAKLEGTEKICLKMTSEKVLTLNNVLYIPELRRNLISVSLLDKNGFKCVTIYEKIVISKGEMYVEKGYLTEGLCRMNVMTVEINKSSNSSYLLESYDLWHERLGHVNYKTLRKLINLEVLPNFECNKSKCQTCVESKYAKHSYKSVERNSNPLDLIHTDICDMKSTPSRGGKRDICDINATKRMLESKFDIKDLRVAVVILGIRIHRTLQGLALSQSHYIKKVLDKFKNMEFGIVKTPLDVNITFRKNEGKSDSQLEYARVLGCLMYIMNCTRSDIACSISKLSRYTSNPNKTHWMAMKTVLGYLKYTQNYALHYNKYPAVLEGYSDANWITGSNEVKSTSGYVFTISGGAVSWKSSKQTCIARSTMESEFIALDKASEEAEWLQNFLEDIPYWPKPVAPICTHCDSHAAIGMAESMMYNGKSYHIRRRHNTVRELLSSEIITVDYVKSKDNVSNPLTKGLSREGVEWTSKEMGLRPRTSQHDGNST
ncbi:putative protein-like [Capsicum annuum]|nr:putative protein-like [Capsicum annuum]